MRTLLDLIKIAVGTAFIGTLSTTLFDTVWPGMPLMGKMTLGLVLGFCVAYRCVHWTTKAEKAV